MAQVVPATRMETARLPGPVAMEGTWGVNHWTECSICFSPCMLLKEKKMIKIFLNKLSTLILFLCSSLGFHFAYFTASSFIEICDSI